MKVSCIKLSKFLTKSLYFGKPSKRLICVHFGDSVDAVIFAAAAAAAANDDDVENDGPCL